MKDITEIFKKVVSSKIDWIYSIFYLVVDKLKDKGVRISFWDGEENWASILVNNRTVGYIWKKYPIVIFEKGAIPNMQILLRDIENIYYVEVDSLTNDLFRIEDDELHKYFDGFFDFNSFTWENLWFNTNAV